jgi:glycosyltransferase involved in cell wall biosynthesis
MRIDGGLDSRPLRVVHVGFYADVERREPEELLSAWPTLLGVAAGLVRAGVETTIVQASAHRQHFERDGVTCHFVDDDRAMPVRPRGRLPIVRRPSRLLERVASRSPDVLHVNGFQYPVAIRQLARAVPGVPIIVQDHYSSAPSGWRGPAWRIVAPRLAGVAFTAREQATPFVASGALSRRTPVFEVFEGSSTFTPGDVSEARRATGLHGDPCLLWTGRLNARKDPLTALAAFERAATRLPNARLWCCHGAAPLLDVVRARIAESSVLSQRVTMLGTVPHADMERLFRAADFFLQTSLDEGCSYSIIEALSCGATPLVTDIPASRRTVGDAGALTPVRDVEALAAAIVAWASRSRGELRLAARLRFEQALSFDVIGRDLRAVYESVTRVA